MGNQFKETSALISHLFQKCHFDRIIKFVEAHSYHFTPLDSLNDNVNRHRWSQIQRVQNSLIRLALRLSKYASARLASGLPYTHSPCRTKSLNQDACKPSR